MLCALSRYWATKLRYKQHTNAHTHTHREPENLPYKQKYPCKLKPEPVRNTFTQQRTYRTWCRQPSFPHILESINMYSIRLDLPIDIFTSLALLLFVSLSFVIVVKPAFRLLSAANSWLQLTTKNGPSEGPYNLDTLHPYNWMRCVLLKLLINFWKLYIFRNATFQFLDNTIFKCLLAVVVVFVGFIVVFLHFCFCSSTFFLLYLKIPALIHSCWLLACTKLHLFYFCQLSCTKNI